MEQLLAFENADSIIIDDLIWLSCDRLPERLESFRANQLLGLNLIGELLARAGFTAEIGAQKNAIQLFAQAVCRSLEPNREHRSAD
jgi:hypothetical protein